MADDSKEFIVVHDIHKAGVNAYAAVAAGEGVNDILVVVYGIVQLEFSKGLETLHDPVKP